MTRSRWQLPRRPCAAPLLHPLARRQSAGWAPAIAGASRASSSAQTLAAVQAGRQAERERERERERESRAGPCITDAVLILWEGNKCSAMEAQVVLCLTCACRTCMQATTTPASQCSRADLSDKATFHTARPRTRASHALTHFPSSTKKSRVALRNHQLYMTLCTCCGRRTRPSCHFAS